MGKKEKDAFGPIVVEWLENRSVQFDDTPKVYTTAVSSWAGECIHIYYRKNNGLGRLRIDVKDYGKLYNTYCSRIKDGGKLFQTDANPRATKGFFAFFVELEDIDSELPFFLCSNPVKPTLSDPKEFIYQTEDKHITGGEREIVVKARINQSAFRSLLLKESGSKCALCGVGQQEFLIASHIKPWKESSDIEKVDVYNGLLLCPNHDKLFDQGYISFDQNGKIQVSDELADESMVFMNIHKEMVIQHAEARKKYLKWHREFVFRSSQK